MALRERGEILQHRLSLGVSRTLAIEHGSPGDTAMATDLGQLGDLSQFEQLDQMPPRYIEDIRGLLGRHGRIVFDDPSPLAGEKEF